jgi:hypothetical protein
MRLSIPLLLIALAAGSLSKKSTTEDSTDNYPVAVELKQKKGSLITVKLTNRGKEEINFFTRATILDPNPVHKVNITSTDGMSLPSSRNPSLTCDGRRRRA